MKLSEESRAWLLTFWEMRGITPREAQCPTPLRYEDGSVGRCVLNALHTNIDIVTVDVPHADKDGRLADLLVHRDTIRQAAHFGWMYPNGIDLRDPDVYGEAPCPCGCGSTADNVREWRNA